MAIPSLATSLCGIALRNPVLAASGTFGYGLEFEKLVDLDALGGLVVKGLSREPMEGNPPPRVYETTGGMINSIGLQNIGVRAFVSEKLPALARLRTAVFANVFGYRTEDYAEVVRVLEDHPGLAGYELNVSCPNTSHGGIYFSSDPALLAGVVAAVKRVARRPVIVKLSPNVGAIEPLAQRRGIERRRRPLSGQHLHRAGHRCAHAPPPHRRRFRRAFRSRHQAHRSAAGLPGGAGGEDPRDRTGRNRHRPGCRRVPDRRRQRRSGGHGQLLGPALAGAHRRGTGAVSSSGRAFPTSPPRGKLGDAASPKQTPRSPRHSL